MAWALGGSLAFVCPRYGTEVLGGAETVVRQMAELLVGRGLPVEVLTTCAVDHHTWANHYPAGTSDVNGVTVRRFPIERGDDRRQRAIGDLIGAGVRVSLADQERWLNEGFRSAGLYHYLWQHHGAYHTVLLTPYMFWTTYACAQIAPHKTVLRPCLHDEVFARLEIYRPMFRDARGIIFNSQPEAELAASLFELPDRWRVAPEGVEVPERYDPARFRAKFGIDGDFIVYGGRREWGKNVDWLVELFERYIRRTGRDLRLVLFGKGDVRIPPEAASHVIDLGFVSDEDKHDAFAAATVACQPSRWESFSRLLMHAWLAGTPTLSFGGCAVTAYHTRQSGGGLVFEDAIDFEVALDLLLDRPRLRAEMASRGGRYVLDNFRWDHVIDALVGCIDAWASQDAGAMA